MSRITRIERAKPYLRAMDRMGLDAVHMAAIEAGIALAPEQHPVVKGVGVRKARIALPGRGKSGGGRVIYYVHLGSTLFMMFAYPKNEQEDLTPAQRKALIALVSGIVKEGRDG
ncbi:type II toxin-antitoxin system RelE/ParE family toxin [Xanthobacteraceae bacterium A53D]